MIVSRQRPDTPVGISTLLWGSVVVAWLVTLLLITWGRGDLLMNHDGLLDNRTRDLPLALLLFIGTWQLMTLAMMLPSSLPLAQIFVQVAQRQPRTRIVFGLFLLGYFAVWTGFAVVALAGDTGLHWLVDQWSWLDRRQWLIEGSVLTLAGVFQFSPLKERCLDACRDPLSFLWRNYARGPAAAWRLGIAHGMFCLGCCWALMLTMFAVGVGSLAWMTAITGVMVVEKTMPSGRKLVPWVGAALVVWGALVLLRVI
jgi:predicted metal-binding membrane protein